MPDSPKDDSSTLDPVEQEAREAVDGANDPALTKDDLKDFAGALAKSFAESRPAVQPAAPAQPATDPAAEQRERIEAYNKAREEINELAAAGNAAEAMERFVQVAQSAVPQVNPADLPQNKALRSQARHLIVAEHKETFNKYGAEIEAEVDRLGVDKSITVEGYQEAISIIRGRHMDEILAAEREAWEKGRRQAAQPPPVARGTRSSRPAAAITEDDLTAEQLEAANMLNMSPGDYAKAKEATESVRLKNGMVPLCSDVPEPGKF